MLSFKVIDKRAIWQNVFSPKSQSAKISDLLVGLDVPVGGLEAVDDAEDEDGPDKDDPEP